MSYNTDCFDSICGDCAGVDIATITADDIRAQSKIWETQGEPITDYEIDAAIIGLNEYQREVRES